MVRRSGSLLSELKSVKLYKCDILDLIKAQQLPTYRYLIERYLTLLKEKPSNLRQKKECSYFRTCQRAQIDMDIYEHIATASKSCT